MSKMWKILTVFLVLAALVCLELWRSNRTIDREVVTVARSDLPVGFDGFRIAQISDLHSAQFGRDNETLCRLVAEEQPDIIVITGDVVDKPWDDLDALERTCKALTAIAPTYYVPGNHEYKVEAGRTGARDVLRRIAQAGVTVLQNQAVELERNGDRITLLGVDDPNGRADQISMEDAVRLAHEHYRQNDFLLMLNHRYDRAQEAADCGVQLMLAGHAHGGLIRLPFTDGVIGPSKVLFPKRTNGLYQVDDMSLVVSRGLGNAGWTRRMFNRPHLPIIELHRKIG